jgi:hypothetical protein
MRYFSTKGFSSWKKEAISRRDAFLQAHRRELYGEGTIYLE